MTKNFEQKASTIINTIEDLINARVYKPIDHDYLIE